MLENKNNMAVHMAQAQHNIVADIAARHFAVDKVVAVRQVVPVLELAATVLNHHKHPDDNNNPAYLFLVYRN